MLKVTRQSEPIMEYCVFNNITVGIDQWLPVQSFKCDIKLKSLYNKLTENIG